MKRGSRLFIELSADDLSADILKKRGRNTALLTLRNEHLLHRYLWHCSDRSKAYDWVIDQLSLEFYLTPCTIVQLMEDTVGQLLRIKTELAGKSKQAIKKDMVKKFPYAKWN